MIQNQLTTQREIRSIGEEIGLELGSQMIKSYQESNPVDFHSYMVGKDIITMILSQPGCEGIHFYMAYNEMGENVLVYVGVDGNGSPILEYTSVNNQGGIEKKPGIVANRGNGTWGKRAETSLEDTDFDWGFGID